MDSRYPIVSLGELIKEEREPIGSFDGNGLPVLGVTNISGITSTGIAASEDRSKYLRLGPRRFAYNPYRINVGSIGLSEEGQEGIVSPAYVVFGTHERLDPGYLFYFLKSSEGDTQINFHGNRGTVRAALRFDDLRKIEIPLPVISKQRQIAMRIKELADQIEEASRLRREAVEEVEALLLAELSAAFHQQSEYFGCVRLEELLTEAGYGLSEKCESERMQGGIPVLRIPNVASERIMLTDLKYARLSERDSQRLSLSEGDILVVRTNGSLELVGRSAVVPKLEEPFAFASYMIRLRLDRNRIEPDYAQRMLQHLRVAGVLVDFARTTAGQYNVSLGRLRAAEIPLPPLSEQRRIVTNLDELQVKVNPLKKLQTETAAELDALLPSILDRAFTGQL